MRRASVNGILYPLRTPQDIRAALVALKSASINQRPSPTLTRFIRYQSETPQATEHWQTVVELENSLVGDCEDIANRQASIFRLQGKDADTFIIKHPEYYHIVTCCQGRLYDACISAGMKIDPIYAEIMRELKIIPL